MAGIGAARVGTTEDLLDDPGFRSDIETEAEGYEEFEEIWDDVITSMDELRYESDPEKRLEPENVMKAYAASVAFPDEVTVSRKPYGTERDLDSHVRRHFENLIDNRETLRNSLGWNADDLLNACELVYIDDAVYRFVTETRFEPTDEDLRTARFRRYPEELSPELYHWMEKVDIWWTSLVGERNLDSTTTELFDELYASREDFIRKTTEADVFLPISTNRLIDHEDKRDNIKRRIRRGSSSESRIHEYCYSLVESLV